MNLQTAVYYPQPTDPLEGFSQIPSSYNPPAVQNIVLPLSVESDSLKNRIDRLGQDLAPLKKFSYLHKLEVNGLIKIGYGISNSLIIRSLRLANNVVNLAGHAATIVGAFLVSLSLFCTLADRSTPLLIFSIVSGLALGVSLYLTGVALKSLNTMFLALEKWYTRYSFYRIKQKNIDLLALEEWYKWTRLKEQEKRIQLLRRRLDIQSSLFLDNPTLQKLDSIRQLDLKIIKFREISAHIEEKREKGGLHLLYALNKA